ncbi:MAG: hypothetical protein LUF28_03040, partial [Clostridiales bacterium]|nr:hypothetical protein [Clostridiales bacterium]
MKNRLKQWLSALLAVCLLFSVTTPTAFAAINGYADLSDTTMTESGSITVTFSGEASDTEYYNVQIADESWSTIYVNTNITSGNSYTIAGYSAGTYNIYVGYYKDGTWQSTAYEGNFTVTEDEGDPPDYALSLEISNPTPALGDSVTITADFTVNGHSQV